MGRPSLSVGLDSGCFGKDSGAGRRRRDIEIALEIAADQQRIALDDEEAARFLDALDAVDKDTVARLRELRERA